MEIPFHYCLAGAMEMSNPTCKLSPIWYVPPGIQLDKEALNRVKRKAAQEMLWHQLVMSPKPFGLMAVLGRPIIPGPPAPEFVKKLLRPFAVLKSDSQGNALDSLNGRETENIEIGLRALKFISSVQQTTLVIHNPVYWYMTGERPTPTLDKFIGLAQKANIDVIRMEKYLPFEKGEPEWRRWYNLPHDGHWSDYGAELYGDAVYRVIREKLLNDVLHLRKQTAALK